MKTADVIKHFGKKADLARALGVQRQAINGWKKYVPFSRQLQIENLTGGKFKAMGWQEFREITRAEA